MNKNELLSVLARAGENQQGLADALGLSRPWLSKKINEKDGALFNQAEILTIKQRYNLNDEQIGVIFFTSSVS